MMRAWAFLLLAGCGKIEAEQWKAKFVKETAYHYQTQQIKNAEIAARDLELQNQQEFIRLLNQKVDDLEKRAAQQAKEIAGLRRKLEPARPVQAKVTSVAAEIGVIVISAGKDAGLLEGDELVVKRDGAVIARGSVDRAEAAWAAVKIREKTADPRVGDDVSRS